MKAAVKKQNPPREFYTSEKCYIIEFYNIPDDGEVSVARARVAPGVTTRRHRLKGTAERYCIVEGRGRVEVGELPPQEVKAGDVVLIPPGSPQRVANIGPDDLIFLAVCTPRFSKDIYEEMEDTG